MFIDVCLSFGSFFSHPFTFPSLSPAALNARLSRGARRRQGSVACCAARCVAVPERRSVWHARCHSLLWHLGYSAAQGAAVLDLSLYVFLSVCLSVCMFVCLSEFVVLYFFFLFFFLFSLVKLSCCHTDFFFSPFSSSSSSSPTPPGRRNAGRDRRCRRRGVRCRAACQDQGRPRGGLCGRQGQVRLCALAGH